MYKLNPCIRQNKHHIDIETTKRRILQLLGLNTSLFNECVFFWFDILKTCQSL